MSNISNNFIFSNTKKLTKFKFWYIMIIITSLLCTNLLLGAISSARAPYFVKIGTGSLTGVYYPAGGGICRLVNRAPKSSTKINCSVQSTAGTIFNLNALAIGDIDVGIVQSDFLYMAANGINEFATLKQAYNPQYRALFSLHMESLTVVVREDANIRRFNDLRGKRVSIGSPGSGEHAIMTMLIREKGWTRDVFKSLSYYNAKEQIDSLCDGKIDAAVFAVGHPNGAMHQISKQCKAKIISISDDKDIKRLIRMRPFYSISKIPVGKLYTGKPGEYVETLGIRAMVVTTDKLPDDVAYTIVKSVFNNLPSFQLVHSLFVMLDMDDMIESRVVPIHTGAQRYFNEISDEIKHRKRNKKHKKK